jgi:hypothetical protein
MESKLQSNSGKSEVRVWEYRNQKCRCQAPGDFALCSAILQFIPPHFHVVISCLMTRRDDWIGNSGVFRHLHLDEIAADVGER